MLSTFQATRYLIPLKEGGSLPAVLDTDGGGLFVAKFRGAGQGARALIAEILVGEIARAIDLPIPEIALIEVDESFGRSEGDPEIQDLLRASHGVNVGLRYLEGAFNFDAASDLAQVDSHLAAKVVWLDSLTLNLDRTAHNTNMLVWQGDTWLIDHGAALYFHHDWESVTRETAQRPFPLIGQHVLLGGGDAMEVDEQCASDLSEGTLTSIVDAVPDALLLDAPAGMTAPFETATEARAAYMNFFLSRLESPRDFASAASQEHSKALGLRHERKDARR